MSGDHGGPSAHRTRTSRPLELVRGAWGLACLVAPHQVGRATGSRPADHRALVVTRALGARHLVQAALSGLAPGPATLAVGVWVDVVHSATAVGLAVINPRRAPRALLDAGIAAGWAVAGARDVETPDVVANGIDPVATERLARAVLPWFPLAPAAPLPDGSAGRR